jgi:hypothetical protein
MPGHNARPIRHYVGRKVAGDRISRECCNPGTRARSDLPRAKDHWFQDDGTVDGLRVVRRAAMRLREQVVNLPSEGKTRGRRKNDMAKQPSPSGRSGPPRPQPPGSDLVPREDPPAQPQLEPIEQPKRASVRPAARQSRSKRPWDRYDAIGAAIVLFLVVLWALHFLLPAPPPTNVP